MAASVVDMPVETVKGMFCAGTGYQTARIETRAAVMRDGKLLMVQEAKGKWALPGVLAGRPPDRPRENTVKEVLEEAGKTSWGYARVNRALRLSPPQHEQGPIPL